jgi:hypothetical protein
MNTTWMDGALIRVNGINISPYYVADMQCAMAYAAGYMRMQQPRQLRKDSTLYELAKKAYAHRGTESPIWIAYYHGRNGKRPSFRTEESDVEFDNPQDAPMQEPDLVSIIHGAEVEPDSDPDKAPEDPEVQKETAQETEETHVLDALKSIGTKL